MSNKTQIHVTARVHPSAVIPDDIKIGKYCVIGPGVKILTPSAWIRDFTRIHDNTLVSGTRSFYTGYNCWIGNGCILDTRGNLIISNGVGIGAYSQLWTHARFGDTLQGCRFNTEKEMFIEHDVWFVGHCIVSPIHAKPWSMALVGSVVTKDMEENRIYAGVPACDVSNKLGGQRDILTELEIHRRFTTLVQQFIERYPKNSKYFDETKFSPVTRFYTPETQEELIQVQDLFLNFAYPLAKFIPNEEI